ncbi:MAG: PIN domain-containing protein [Actinobacteria bacterium]|nr:PIN domain-containing protein [Actinomycetota bacterium]
MAKIKPVLIDTSAWILALRPGLSLEASSTIDKLISESRAVTLPVIILELLCGVKSRREHKELKEDLAAIPSLLQDEAVWDSPYDLGYELKRAGLNLPAVDLIICGTALAHGCQVLHADKHFELVAKHTGLKTTSLL